MARCCKNWLAMTMFLCIWFLVPVLCLVVGVALVGHVSTDVITGFIVVGILWFVFTPCALAGVQIGYGERIDQLCCPESVLRALRVHSHKSAVITDIGSGGAVHNGANSLNSKQQRHHTADIHDHKGNEHKAAIKTHSNVSDSSALSGSAFHLEINQKSHSEVSPVAYIKKSNKSPRPNIYIVTENEHPPSPEFSSTVFIHEDGNLDDADTNFPNFNMSSKSKSHTRNAVVTNRSSPKTVGYDNAAFAESPDSFSQHRNRNVRRTSIASQCSDRSDLTDVETPHDENHGHVGSRGHSRDSAGHHGDFSLIGFLQSHEHALHRESLLHRHKQGDHDLGEFSKDPPVHPLGGSPFTGKHRIKVKHSADQTKKDNGDHHGGHVHFALNGDDVITDDVTSHAENGTQASHARKSCLKNNNGDHHKIHEDSTVDVVKHDQNLAIDAEEDLSFHNAMPKPALARIDSQEWPFEPERDYHPEDNVVLPQDEMIDSHQNEADTTES